MRTVTMLVLALVISAAPALAGEVSGNIQQTPHEGSTQPLRSASIEVYYLVRNPDGSYRDKVIQSGATSSEGKFKLDVKRTGSYRLRVRLHRRYDKASRRYVYPSVDIRSSREPQKYTLHLKQQGAGGIWILNR